jgi:hypothetical protein
MAPFREECKRVDVTGFSSFVSANQNPSNFFFHLHKTFLQRETQAHIKKTAHEHFWREYLIPREEKFVPTLSKTFPQLLRNQKERRCRLGVIIVRNK